MNNNSLWQEVKISEVKTKLNYDKIDILIIGGGITGLTLAYYLKDSNKNIMLIDKGKIGNGITARTTAKINYLQEIIYQTLVLKHGEDKARDYLFSQIDAINYLKTIIEKNNIDCDLKKVDSLIFTLKNQNVKKIIREKELLEKFKIKVEYVNDKRIKKGIKVSDTYVFHPLKYLNGLKNIIDKKVAIYEDTLATSITKTGEFYEIKTNQGTIKSEIVVMACNYPFNIIPGFIPLKTYVKREYVNVGICKNPKNITAINIDKDLHSIRYYDKYVIYGSNSQKVTDKIDYENQYLKSQKDFKKYFHLHPIYTWINQDVMSNDYLPFIGEIKKNLYMSTAYQAWGMTNGTIGAKLISDHINHRYNRYNTLFDPKRFNTTLLVDSFVGSFRYMKAYINAFKCKHNPYYIKINGIIYGFLKDQEGIIHRIKLVCPHMKCNLVFNEAESTWDCPCHGSRFTKYGKLIIGPATQDLENIEIKKSN